MTGVRGPSPLDDLNRRLAAIRERRRDDASETGPDDTAKSAMGYALRIGVELVAGLVVGGGMGWLLDMWLGTSPFLLILFFFLGAAAGMLNVWRATRTMNLPDAPGD
ncbi:MAG: AtpZ/AtpI family protein [Rhodospirillaceae bacterium]|nr:AtpZ/AtpI family protein [Rhodospirillaceae bacterium]